MGVKVWRRSTPIHRHRSSSGKRRSWSIEFLESRSLQSVSPLAVLNGVLPKSGLGSPVTIQINGTQFKLPRGRAYFRVNTETTPISGLPQPLQMGPFIQENTTAQPVQFERASAERLVFLSYGLYGFQTGVGNTSGTAFQVGIALGGDVDGNGQVTQSDVKAIRGLIGTEANQPGYLLSADVNDNGIIDTGDVALAKRNVGLKALTLPPSIQA